MKQILHCAVVFLYLTAIAGFSQTNVPAGNICNTTWTSGGSPYNIQGDITIPNGCTLTIDPGVTISFQGKYYFNVLGRLLALGTSGSNIFFTTSNTTNGWWGIRFDNTPASNDTSKLLYCNIQWGKATGSVNDAYGGAMFFNNVSKAIVSGCTIVNNTAKYGGGIACLGSNPVILNNSINNNSTSGSGAKGGGIYCGGSSLPQISGNYIFNNTGAGIYCDSSNPAISNNNNINNNSQGGIYCNTSSPSMSGNIINGNTNYGGIYCTSSSPAISNNSISNNSTSSSNVGGGITCNNSSPNISGNTINNNIGNNGGGIYCVNSSAIISNNTISNNTAYFSGGGVYCNNNSSPILSQNTICNNGADYGGGICCISNSSPTITNNTIANNSASPNGGALYCQTNSSPTFRNTILWGNTGSNGAQVNMLDAQSDPSFYYCNVQGGSAGFYKGSGTYGGNYENNINSNPLFVGPSGGSGTGFNGTTANWSLQDGSPCINTGDPTTTSPATDKAGNPRLVCIIDMGAYENQTGSTVSTSTTQQDVSCNGGNNGSATVTASNGTTPYTYQWSNGQTSSTATGLSAGTFYITVTDGGLCNETDSVVITQPIMLTISATSTETTCNGTCNGTLSASGSDGVSPYSYNWSGFLGTGADKYNVCAGTYTVTITDSNSCTKTATATVSQPSAIMISISKTDISCNGGSDGIASASASGGVPGYSYLWDNGQTTQTVTGLLTGTYFITVTDANGCTKISSVNITQPPVLTCGVSTQTNVSCNGGSNGSATITAAGGTTSYSYLWNTGGTSSSISNRNAGTYTVTVTDSKGCTASIFLTITEPANPLTSAITASDSTTCNGGNDGFASAGANGGTSPYSFSWNTNPVQTTATANNLFAGNYTVLISDSNGCTSNSSVTILQPPAINPNASVINNVTCNGGNDGSATVSVGNGVLPYSYQWSSLQTTDTVNNLSAGTYTITVTDGNNCAKTTSVTINQPQTISISFNKTNVSCNGGNDGSVTATASGGTPGFSYLWSNSQSTQSISNLPAGTYSITVTDNNGCTNNSSVTIAEPFTLAASISAGEVSCNGDTDGSLAVITTGGTSPYSFLWSNGGNTDIISGLTAGIYSATISDSNGCVVSVSDTVTEPQALSSSVISTNVTCNGGNNGSAMATVSGGVSPYSFIWSDGQTTPSATGLSAISYSVTATDANNCSIMASVNISEPNAIFTNLSSSPVSCNNGNNGTAAVSVSGGASPYEYLWNNGQINSVSTGLVAGDYFVTVTDTNTCVKIDSITVSEPQAISVTSGTDAAICSGESVFLGWAPTASGGISPYSYLWSPDSGLNSSVIANPTATPDSTTAYFVSVTDANACSVSSPVITVTVNPLPPIPTIIQFDTIVKCSIDGMPYYQWSLNGNIISGETTKFCNFIGNGFYSVTITDDNGCSSTSGDTLLLIGVEEIKNGISFAVFPNPNLGTFTVMIENIVSDEVQVNIINLLGERVYVSELKKANGKYTNEIHLGENANGIYYLQLSIDEKSYFKKIMVQ